MQGNLPNEQPIDPPLAPALLPHPTARPRWIRWLWTLIILAILAVVTLVFYMALQRYLGPPRPYPALPLPFEEAFVETPLRDWPSEGGAWGLREEQLSQSVSLDQAAHLFLPYSLADDQLYHASIYLTFSPRTQAAGLSFNGQFPDAHRKQHRAYILQKPAGDWSVVVGYTDEGGTFVTQVEVPFTSVAEEYRLDVFVYTTTYSVQVNGQTLIADRPLFFKGGMLGFYAIGPVRFDTLKVSTAVEARAEDLVYRSDFDAAYGAAGWVPFRGDWQVQDAALVQLDPEGYDNGIGYEGSAFSDSAYEVRLRHLTGVGGGLLFNMPSPYQINGAQVVRFSEQADAIYWGYFDASGQFNRQGFADIAPPGTDEQLLQVYAGATRYDIYLNRQLLARDVPTQSPTGHFGLTTSRAGVAFAAVEIYPLLGPRLVEVVPQVTTVAAAPITATVAGPSVTTSPLTGTAPIATPAATPTAAATVVPTPLPAESPLIRGGGDAPYRGDFRGDVAGSGWQPISGEWRMADGALLQSNATAFDQAIVYTRQAFQNYTLDVSFVLDEGSGAGVLFNMPFANRLNGAHMVRLADQRADGMFWGYYDAERHFIGQGYANVTPAADGRHHLRIVVDATTYRISIDGTTVAQDIPLIQSYGYMGLITNRATAAYSQVSLGGVALPLTAPGTYGGDDLGDDQAIVNGEWEVGAGEFRQVNPADADFILNTGMLAGNYTLAAEIVLPEIAASSPLSTGGALTTAVEVTAAATLTAPIAAVNAALINPAAIGGGLIFHMPTADRRHGAWMVRLVNEGTRVIWGRYDDNGLFVGRNAAEITPVANRTYRVQLAVRGDEFDFTVNGRTLVTNEPLAAGSGWIGLLAHGGPILFRNVTITVGTTP